jgi:tetratricopeptide (TPR) repeat protein
VLAAAIQCGALLTPALADELDICFGYQKPRAAIAACTRMIRAGEYEHMSRVYSARGVAYRWSGDYDRAISDFNEAIRLDPEFSIAFGQRGIAYSLKGNRARALADLKTAVELDPDNQTAVDELRKLRNR